MIENLMYEFYQLPALYEKIALEAGDNFNLFELLVSRDNEAMHSKFIGELLNPSGSHGQGYTFLKLFVDYLKIENFDTQTAKLYLEYHISSKTDTEGGRIDIFIQDKNGVSIAIENKIWAGDQNAQLLRYYNFIKNNSNSRLFYLNLFGNEPTKESTQTLKKEDYQIISYTAHISDWLHLCREKAANLPILRESISQYINLIKSLTHQTNNAKMNKEIVKSILDKNNSDKLTAYLNLVENQDVKNAVYNKILEKLKADLQQFGDETGLIFNHFNLNLSQPHTGFAFENEKMNDFGIHIRYHFCKEDWKGLIFGFLHNNKENAEHEKLEKIKAKFKQQFSFFPNPHELWACHTKKHKDWGKEQLEMIYNGKTAELISKEVDIMLNIINSIE